MDQDQRTLVRHLFAEIAVRLEAAHALAADGQDPGLRLMRGRAITLELQAALADATGLAAAIQALVVRAKPARPVRRTHEAPAPRRQTSRSR